MLRLIKRNLTVQIVIVFGIVLALAFTLLCYLILNRQTALLSGMSETVKTQLSASAATTQQTFNKIETSVTAELQDMNRGTATNLTKATEAALQKTEQSIDGSMENLLKKSAEMVALLLNTMVPDAIMGEDYVKLQDYSRAIAQTDDIIFVMFQNDKKEILPSYLNVVDDKIIGYLDNGNQDLDEPDRVLAQARNDASVMLYEHPVIYYNLPIGTIFVCISKKIINKELESISGQFQTLKQSSAQSVSDVLNSASVAVVNHINAMLKEVTGDTDTTNRKTSALLHQVLKDINAEIGGLVVMIGTIYCVVLLVLAVITLKVMVLSPIKQVAQGLQDAAQGEGDLTKRLASQRQDEIGVLSGWFNSFVERINDIIVEINGNSETVTSSTMEVLNSSEQMQHEAKGLSNRADKVAASSRTMNDSIASVAAASEQASSNIALVATTAAEMKAALDRVAEHCNEAQTISTSASHQVQKATDKVARLNSAAEQISKVTEVITEIADQTNLLALNATIEAARAGESGKGFAVVAGEIKGLANQTQAATSEIKQKIDGIQNSTHETIVEVEAITEVIDGVNEIMTRIAEAMVEQAERASEVALNIEQASQGIAEMNQNVNQSSMVTTEIAAETGEVSRIAQTMLDASAGMLQSSGALNELANQLRKMISVFKVSERRGSGSGTEDKNIPQAADIPDLFTWSSQLSVGIDSIDRQHKELVKYINQLHRAMRTKRGAQECAQILDRLVDYTVYHFDNEEKLFEGHGYPETQEHKRYHKNLVDSVVKIQNDVKAGRAGISIELMEFLTKWLRDHIMKKDKAYSRFLKDKGVLS